MVTQRKDYRFVDIPKDIKIDGSVMPHRGNKDLLLGEDPSFILESFAERDYVRYGCYAAPSFKMTKVIEGARYRTVIDQYKDWVRLPYHADGKPLDPLWGPQSEYSGGSEYSLKAPCELDPDARLTLVGFKGNSNLFNRGRPVERQPIMDVYDDLRLLRHFQVYIPQYGLLSDTSYSRSVEGKFDVERYIEPPCIWRWYSRTQWEGDTKIWAAETKTLSGGRFYFKTESDFPDWVDIDETRIWIQFFFLWRTYDSPEGDWSTHERSYLAPMHCTRYYDGFTIRIEDIMTKFRHFKNWLPCIYNPLNLHGGTYRAECSIHADWVTTKLGLHTKWWA